jgi:hypothetical protein
VSGEGVVPDAFVRILRASVDTEFSQQSTYSCVAGPAVLLTVDLKRP